MKPIIQKLWMFIVLLCTSIPASAYDFEVDGIYYNVVSLQDLTCEVTKGDKDYTGEVVIPAKVTFNNRTLFVVAVRKDAFCENKSIKKVIIPNSVTVIKDETFWGCSSLTSVTIPNSVTEIGKSAFFSCTSLTTVTIPNSVTEIGEAAFNRCSSLTTVTIPNSVTKIGFDTFGRCSSLTTVTIPNSVTEIGSYAFEYCRSLTTVNIPNSVTEIHHRTFSGCSSLTTITIPNSVTEIKSEAFNGCSSLTTITIPDSVTEIDNLAFSHCDSLISIELGNSIEKLGHSMFNYCTKLKSITFPGSVSSVDWADYDQSGFFFQECENLGEMKFLYGEQTLRVDNLLLDRLSHPVPLKHLYIDRKIEWGERTGICIQQIKQLSLGPNLHDIKLPSDLSNYKELEVINCYSLEPPKIREFSNAQYLHVIVRVPDEALEAYKQADVWKNFWNIEAISTTGIESVDGDTKKTIIGRYDLCGRLVSDDYKGISIIRYSDGSTKKILK